MTNLEKRVRFRIKFYLALQWAIVVFVASPDRSGEYLEWPAWVIGVVMCVCLFYLSRIEADRLIRARAIGEEED